MKDNKTYEHVFVKRQVETDKAVLLIDDTGEEVWLPLSQVEEMHEAKDGTVRVVMSEWIAKQKGLK
jgi:hypothetical protein